MGTGVELVPVVYGPGGPGSSGIGSLIGNGSIVSLPANQNDSWVTLPLPNLTIPAGTSYVGVLNSDAFSCCGVASGQPGAGPNARDTYAARPFTQGPAHSGLTWTAGSGSIAIYATIL